MAFESNSKDLSYDVIIVGGGFSGCCSLHMLRKAGFSVILFEAAESLGGIWATNRYPGARVDCEMPWYGFSDPQIWSDWTWEQRFPDAACIKRYFEHVADVWSLNDSIKLQTRVTAATYLGDANTRWQVETDRSDTYQCRWLVMGCGTSSKPYTPPWQGRDAFRGLICHSSQWPKETVDLTAKRLAVVGAGSTGIQVVQAAAKLCSSITHFIRAPIFAFPMRQRAVSQEEIQARKRTFQQIFEVCRQSRVGLPIASTGRRVFDDTPAQRQALLEGLWQKGGWHFLQGSYIDYVSNPDANRELYAFWCKKVRERLDDPTKRDILAPHEPPYFLAAKRPGLEETYYAACNEPTVEVCNTPIERFTEDGVLTEDGKPRHFDIVVLCTGYDAVDGTLRAIEIQGRSSITLNEKWTTSVTTHLGLMTNGFPNMFILYGPQAPTSSAIAPIFVEQQCELLRDVLVKQQEEGIKAIEPSVAAEQSWCEEVMKVAANTLIPTSNSWAMGANVPGKIKQPLIYWGGMPAYFEHCQRAFDGWQDFDLQL